MDEPRSTVTRLLDAVARGEPHASEQLLPLVYSDLRELARAKMSRLPPGQTLQPTALVHDAYMRVARDADLGWDHRGHFFAAAARAMREILIEQARRKGRLRHGGAHRRVEPENLALPIEAPASDMLALDEALHRLDQDYPRQHRVVMLRFFAGLTSEETAKVTGSSLRTVERDWRYARAWLHTELVEPDAGPASGDDDE